MLQPHRNVHEAPSGHRFSRGLNDARRFALWLPPVQKAMLGSPSHYQLAETPIAVLVARSCAVRLIAALGRIRNI
jgi:hypothetical protein